MNKLTLEQEKDLIIRKNNGELIKNLMNYFNIKSEKTIYDVIKRDGREKLVANKKYNINNEYFKLIDNQDKAYWLGFIFADGYVRMKYNRSGELRLKLATKDLEHIEKFKKCIDSTHKIISTQSKVIYDGKISISECVSLSIYNTELVKDLYSHGCINNKTFTIEFPDLREDLIRHFIRGVFDGDGSFGEYNRKRSFTIVSASKKFIESIVKILTDSLLSDRVNLYENSQGKNTIYILSISNCVDLKSLYDYLYNNSNIFLYRKEVSMKQSLDKLL